MAAQPARSIKPPSRRSRLRPAVAFGAAFVIVAVAIGAVALLLRGNGTPVAEGGAETSAVPSSTAPPAPTTIPATTTTVPATTTTVPATSTTVPATTTTEPMPFVGVVSLDADATEKGIGLPVPGLRLAGRPQGDLLDDGVDCGSGHLR